MGAEILNFRWKGDLYTAWKKHYLLTMAMEGSQDPPLQQWLGLARKGRPSHDLAQDCSSQPAKVPLDRRAASGRV
jgi:hypothetical protein